MRIPAMPRNRKIMQTGIRDIFDVFALMFLIMLLAGDWLYLPEGEWSWIGSALALSGSGSIAGFFLYRWFRRT
jgi:ribosomal protein L16 Arg81 hydroxylase